MENEDTSEYINETFGLRKNCCYGEANREAVYANESFEMMENKRYGDEPDDVYDNESLKREPEDVYANGSFEIRANKQHRKTPEPIKERHIERNKDQEKKSSNKKVCLTLLVSLVVLLLSVASTIAFFIEISKLKSEISNLKSETQQQQNVSIAMSNEQLSEEIITRLRQQGDELLRVLDNTTQRLDASIRSVFEAMVGQNYSHMSSCVALPPSSPSGYYWVRPSNGPAVRVYCDMTRSCGNVTGGWMRVAELDMTNRSHQCPSGLGQRNIRTCSRVDTAVGCNSLEDFTASHGIEYSQVCGRIKGYQFGSTDGFTGSGCIDCPYVDGVSITHGRQSRRHIWTFSAALQETDCGCYRDDQGSRRTNTPPSFVASDYFCDAGSQDYAGLIFYADNPLWDGAGCGPQSSCCSFNDPPWFYKQLPQPTIDDVEVRVCTSGDPIGNEDIAIETVQIYIQ
jgi:cell division protein FtsB